MVRAASTLEIVWTTVALIGLVFTIGLILWARFSIRAIFSGIQRGTVVRWGPRWNLVLCLTIAAILLALGWIGYIAIGVIAMYVPSAPTEEAKTASQVFAWVLVAMETFHAGACVALWAAFVSLSGKPIPLLNQMFRKEVK